MPDYLLISEEKKSTDAFLKNVGILPGFEVLLNSIDVMKLFLAGNTKAVFMSYVRG